MEERWERFYVEGLGENRRALEEFRKLARERGWKIYARTQYGSIGMFDLGSFTYKPLDSRPSGIGKDTSEASRQLSSIEEVDRVILVGQNVVFEREESCYLHDPVTGKSENLVSGRLSVSWSDEEFLFYTSEWKGSESGEAWCEHWLFHRFNIRTRRAEFIWMAPRFSPGFNLYRDEPKPYDPERVLLSPDRRFLLIPWNVNWSSGKGPLYSVREYELYQLATGEMRGAFLAPQVDGEDLEFLGWVEDE
jgi:hypothetical protein